MLGERAVGDLGRLALGGKAEEGADKELQDGHRVELHLQRVGSGAPSRPRESSMASTASTSAANGAKSGLARMSASRNFTRTAWAPR